MSKQERWKESLQAVRESIQAKPVVEETPASEEDTLHEEIENLLNSEFDETIEEDVEIVLGEEGMGDKIGKLFRTKDKKEINGIANLMNMTSVKVLQSMQKQNPKGFKRMTAKMGELPAMEEVQEESTETPERTIEKLAERNMLGRLAKQLKLNEEGKQKMFNYFEKGELQQ